MMKGPPAMMTRIKTILRHDPDTLAGDFLGAFALVVMLVAFLHLPVLA